MIMRTRFLAIVFGLLMAADSLLATAQDKAGVASAHDELQRIHAPGSIDEQQNRLTQDLQLSASQQNQVRQLLQQHHARIQLLLDKNPTATRQALASQIHAVSEETHHQIHALLTTHQQELEQAMQQRERSGEESRRQQP
jgi:hypothetical protein